MFNRNNLQTRPRQSMVLIMAMVTFFFAGLAGCSSGPKQPPLPALRIQAQSDEAEGVKKFSKGDYTAAMAYFAQAQRLQQSLDDPQATVRNQLHQARTELALDRNDAALDRAMKVPESDHNVEALLVQFQANLALGRTKDLPVLSEKLRSACAANCAFTGSMFVLLARAALGGQQYDKALEYASTALQFLANKNEPRETANGWRIAASAHLALGRYTEALSAADQALALDRSQALPEKIARDWLLIADIQRHQKSPRTRMSYERALAVAQAANLTTITTIAEKALKENSQ